jgi:diguanylate cyclase (GGDEF)-like protein
MRKLQTNLRSKDTLKLAWKAACQRVLAGFAALVALPALVHADSDVHPMRFDHLTLDNGLSQSSVIAIEQDSAGFMWFGTENGLNRFNGYDVEHLRRERGNPDALRSDFVYALAEADDGGLWIGTNGGGLAYLHASSDRVSTWSHDENDATGIAGDIVRAMLLDSDGKLWLGLRNAGLDRFDPELGRFEHIDLGVTASVFALEKDSNGDLWVGTDQGLFRVASQDGAVRQFVHAADDAASISGDRIRSIYEDGQGNLWIGTRRAGLNRFDRQSSSFTRFGHDPSDAASISSDRVTTILEDGDGRLWIGTADGLNLMNRQDGTFTRFHREADNGLSLGDNSVAALFEDRSGILWVGTLTGGVSKWNPRTWGLGLRDSGSILADPAVQPNVTSFATDGNGTLWIGTFGDGLVQRNRDTGESVVYRHDPENPKSISGDRVMSLHLASDGSVWVGTMMGGLNRLDPETGNSTVFQHDPDDVTSLSANGIMAIHEDSRGHVWVGTFGGGISVFDPATGNFTRYGADATTPGALSSDRVTSFAEESSGRLWIGTDAGGLNVFNPESATFHALRYDPNDPQSLSADTVYALHIDARGTVWVGTRGGGLDRVVGSSANPEQVTFENISQRDGLSNDVVYGVQSSASGEVWVSTNFGISRIDPNSGAVRQLHRRDGLQSEEFNFGAHHRGADGELFFGGQNGYNAFRPEELVSNAAIPPVILSGFFLSNDPTKAELPENFEDGIELGYRDDHVSFEVAALDFTAPAMNQYMYKLEGIDDEWIDLGNRRRITYTDLDAGNYVLRVKAANSDGVWNDVGLALPVRVAPAPWETWWAYLGYVAAVAQLALFLWLSHKRKLRREEEYSYRLEQEVRARTDELASRNVELKQLARSLQESSLSDPLTGLRNRRFVFEEVSRELVTIARKYGNERDGLDPRDASDLVFMMIDLDNFKPINDTYGHAAGDKMLLDIRDVLLKTCRRSDFVIRWGGDEFVVIAKQAHAGESEALAERIRHQVESSEFELPEGQVVRTTCSIGFSSFPLFRNQAEDGNLDDIINVADSLMYEAKRQKNAWVGMLDINEAVTSANFELEVSDPTSLLFMARRQGRVTRYQPHDEDQAASVG